MHTFFKTLFQFIVLSKVLCCLQNDNSTLNSDAIQVSVNKLFSIPQIANFVTQCNKQERIVAYNAIRYKLASY